MDSRVVRSIRLCTLVLLMVMVILCVGPAQAQPVARRAQGPGNVGPQANGDRYVIVAWNDLGMHCYNPDFRDLAVLPPYNTLWAQVIRVGDPPQIVTSNIVVSYSFPDNTYSVGKTNFWDYVTALIGVPVPPNTGLKGKGLAGTMNLHGDHFVAEGIPLTEYSDSAPTVRYPYQLATIIARDAVSSAELARLTVVAPVSSEMRCDLCHYDGGVEGIRTGRVETNILTLHDREEADDYPAGHQGLLMNRRPILCAECHADNALELAGLPGVPNLSRAMHAKHFEEGGVPQTQEGCYYCHPGPETRCLRDIMSQRGMTCLDCHGNMQAVAQNPNPWLQEPRCDNGSCHGAGYAQNQPLYRNSTGHGGVYCAGCHDSPHAIAPSRQANDGIKFIELQRRAGPIAECTVCHTSAPAQAGPHGAMPPEHVRLPFMLAKW